VNNWWERLLDWLHIPVTPEFQEDLSPLDQADGLGGGKANALSVGELEGWDRFWILEQDEKDDLQRYIAGDYPA
jgi:hypothetical protein